MTNAPKYRLATHDNETDILAVLKEVASEIPVSLGTPESLDAIKSIIVECCASGESWVAVDASDTVVGFALAKPDIMERFHNENDALYLPYLGVKKDSRKCGIFAALMERLMGKGVPLTAKVLHSNCSDMTNRLMKVEFTKVGSDAKEMKLRWAPKQAGTNGPKVA